MTAIIINLDDYRKEKEHSRAFKEALKAVEENGKSPLKGIEAVDEHFKKHPFDADKIF
ncbi:MAG: hypothetical protein IKS41_05885 [Alphaproteobacteria bacterium]|nr:hypothetical protein [Alphaproteobacteria bacterium]